MLLSLCCQMELEIQVPHMARLTTRQEGSSLLLGRAGHFGSTLILHCSSPAGKGMSASLLLPRPPRYCWMRAEVQTSHMVSTDSAERARFCLMGIKALLPT